MLATLTPNRAVTVEIDKPGTVLNEPFFSKTLLFSEIVSPTLTNVEQLASGTWILKPRETALHALHETTTGQASIVRLSATEHPTWLEEIPVQRTFPELPWLTSPAAGVSTSGDHLMIKRIPAGATEAVGITTAIIHPTPPTTPVYPMRPVAQFKNDGVRGIDEANQGYVIRWIHPIHPQGLIDAVCSFTFGGDISSEGYGRFTVTFTGDGQAFLYEWIGNPGAWVRVNQWQYCPSELAPRSGHVCRIIPHVRWIEFRSNVNEPNFPSLVHLNRRLDPYQGNEIQTSAFTHRVTGRENLAAFPGGLAYPVTGPGQWLFWVREDLLLRFQVARVTYPASGTLRAQPFTVPGIDTSTHVLNIRRFLQVMFNGAVPRGNASAAVYNGVTGAALGAASENWTVNGKTYVLNGFTLPGRPNAVAVEITLVNNDGAGGPYSPWLFGFEAHKIGNTGTNGAAAITITGANDRQSPVEQVSITGADNDPSHESAALTIRDLTNRIPRLQVRGEGRLRILTTFSETSAQQAVLFDGYFIKSEARLRGKAGKVYPSSNWADLALTCLGRWKRLHENLYISKEFLNLAVDLDPTVPAKVGLSQPTKATDAIRFLLIHRGVPEAQTDIPDLDVRLWGNTIDGHDSMRVQPGSNCIDVARWIAESFLNYFLIWDGSAGSDGMWRLKPVPKGTETSVWTFTEIPPSAGRISTHPGSYPANTTFVARDSLIEWTSPPEGTSVIGSGEVDGKVFMAEAHNPKAFNRPGGATADPTHADYTDGSYRPIYLKHDPTLLTRGAVWFKVRRTFDIACRARQFKRFACPLPLIDAATLEPLIYTTYPRRPLMFGDVVTYQPRSGSSFKAMIRNCNIQIQRQHFMIGNIQLVRFPDALPA